MLFNTFLPKNYNKKSISEKGEIWHVFADPITFFLIQEHLLCHKMMYGSRNIEVLKILSQDHCLPWIRYIKSEFILYLHNVMS